MTCIQSSLLAVDKAHVDFYPSEDGTFNSTNIPMVVVQYNNVTEATTSSTIHVDTICVFRYQVIYFTVWCLTLATVCIFSLASIRKYIAMFYCGASELPMVYPRRMTRYLEKHWPR